MHIKKIKKQLVVCAVGIVLILLIVVLTGCFGSENVKKSELDRLAGTWGELSYDQFGGETVIGNVTFNNDGTGVSYNSEIFPEKFNFSISEGKLNIKYGVPEESNIYGYSFSDDYETLRIRNTLGGSTTFYTKQ